MHITELSATFTGRVIYQWRGTNALSIEVDQATSDRVVALVEQYETEQRVRVITSMIISEPYLSLHFPIPADYNTLRNKTVSFQARLVACNGGPKLFHDVLLTNSAELELVGNIVVVDDVSPVPMA